VPLDPETRRRALSSLLLGFGGPVPPGWLLDALRDGLGGVVLFGSNVADGEDVGALTDQLRASAGRELIIAMDEEGGDVTRLDVRHGSACPGAAALGYLDDVAATEASYAEIGARLARAAVTLNLAPVADVNVEPRNPVIGVRSFGADPQVASRHVAAAVRGLQGAGVAACAKHFPGHGATRADSHLGVAVLDRTPKELDQVEFAPFRAAIAAGVRAVITGHLLAPALDPANLATVSPAVISALRDGLGFGGAIVTDALEMQAVAGTLGLAGGFVRALSAGADVVETGAQDQPEFVPELLVAVEAALRTGRLSEERLVDASHRAGALAHRGDAGRSIGPDDVAARCVQVIGRLPRLVRPLVVECRPPGGLASGELPWTLGARLAARVPDTQTVPVDATTAARPVLDGAAGRTLIVVVRDPLRHAWQQPYLAAIAHRPGAVVVDVGWPTETPPAPIIRTRGVAPGLLDAAVDALVTASTASAAPA
jgi:beta-N-acetylhexosaminidase